MNKQDRKKIETELSIQIEKELSKISISATQKLTADIKSYCKKLSKKFYKTLQEIEKSTPVVDTKKAIITKKKQVKKGKKIITHKAKV